MMTTRTERHTDTNKLTRHTASGLPHTLSGRTHHSGHVPPVAPPQHSKVCQETNNSTTTQTGDRGERVRLEQACSASSNLVAGRKARTRPCVGSCEVSMDALLTGYWPAASPRRVATRRRPASRAAARSSCPPPTQRGRDREDIGAAGQGGEGGPDCGRDAEQNVKAVESVGE